MIDEEEDIFNSDETDNGSEELFGDEEEDNSLRVVYVIYVGVDVEGKNVYQFLLSINTEDTFSEGWGEKPAGNIPSNILMIEESMYEYVKELKTDIKLDLAQENLCFSMQDCRDNIVALAYENIDEYDEYPENGRIVVHFGDKIDDVERMLGKRDMFMKFI